MNTTSESLLLRLNTLSHDSIDESAWQEFVVAPGNNGFGGGGGFGGGVF